MTTERPRSSNAGRLAYAATVLLVAGATFGVAMLWQNITQRKAEARQVAFRIVPLTEDTVDPAEWGKNFPRQFDSYSRTVDNTETSHGGSDGVPDDRGPQTAPAPGKAPSIIENDPNWKTIFNGYPFAVDFREARGHAYMLHDQEETERVKQFKQPGACMNCHAAALPVYRELALKHGVPADEAHRQEATFKGFELMNAMPYADVAALAKHPVTCLDCHDPDSIAVRVTRPAFIEGIQSLARSDQPTPHLPSIERWRQGSRAKPYDPNTEASRQEIRSFACAQCHVEYHFAGKEKRLTFPWQQGLKVEQIESHYDQTGWTDWTHKDAGTKQLKAQHPEFELWSQGIHARAGVSCADCHMPYVREGAIKVSNHNVRSPLLDTARSCQTCHTSSEEELKARVKTIQQRTIALEDRAEEAILAAILELKAAKAAGLDEAALAKAHGLHRSAQWRLDFVAAENSEGFHADQESARILAEAADMARQSQIETIRAMAARPKVTAAAAVLPQP